MWGGNSASAFPGANQLLPYGHGAGAAPVEFQMPALPNGLSQFSAMPGMSDPSLAGVDVGLQRMLGAQLRDCSAQQDALRQHLAAESGLNPMNQKQLIAINGAAGAVSPASLLHLGMVNNSSPGPGNRSPNNSSSLSAAITLQQGLVGSLGRIQTPAQPPHHHHHHHHSRHHHHRHEGMRVESDGSNFPTNSHLNFPAPLQQLHRLAAHHRGNLLSANNSSSNQSSSLQPRLFSSPQPSYGLAGTPPLSGTNTHDMPRSPTENVNSVLPGRKGQGSNTVKNDVGSNGSGGSNSNSEAAPDGQTGFKASCGDNGGGSGGTNGSNNDNNNNNNSNNLNDNATAKHERPLPSPHVCSSMGGVKRSRTRDNDKGSGGDENQDMQEEGTNGKQGGNKRSSAAYGCDGTRRRPRASKSVDDLDEDPGAADSDGHSSRQEDSVHRHHKTQQKRLLWTPELHHRFLNAVFHLGINNAGPKYIMQLMNVNGLKRENVASHLQKYRLYLKKIAGVAGKDPVSPALLQQAQEIVMREHAVGESKVASQMVAAPVRPQFDGRNLTQPCNYSGFPASKSSAGMMSTLGVDPLLVQQQQASVFPQLCHLPQPYAPPPAIAQQPPATAGALQQYAMLGATEQNRILAELQQQIQVQQMQLQQQQAQLEAHMIHAQRSHLAMQQHDFSDPMFSPNAQMQQMAGCLAASAAQLGEQQKQMLQASLVAPLPLGMLQQPTSGLTPFGLMQHFPISSDMKMASALQVLH